MLADANGLDEGSPLVAGSTLTAPEVKTSSNDAKTFKPYDPSEITGPTTPSMPYIPPPDKGCGAIGMVIMVVVMIVVTVYTAGLAAGANGAFMATMTSGMSALSGGLVGGVALTAGTAIGASAVGGFVGSVVGQGIGSVMGVTSFSWRNAAVAGASAAITAGIGSTGVLGTIGKSAFAKGAVSAVSGSLVNQAAQRVAGVETSFSWKSIAISAVAGGIGASVGGPLAKGLGFNLGKESGQMAADFISGAAGGLVSSHLRRKVGLERGVNNEAVLADAFGSMLANRITGQHRLAAAEQKNAGAVDNTKAGMMPAKRLSKTDPNAIFGEGGIYATVGRYGDPLAAVTMSGEMPEWAQVQTITVRDGDTLSGLAAQYLGDAEQWAAIAYASGVKGESIQSGQQLVVPAVGSYDPAAMALASGEFYQQKAAMQLAIAAAGPGSGGGGGTGSMSSTAWPQFLSSEDEAFIRGLTELDTGIPLGGSCPIKTYPKVSAYDPSLAARRAQSADAIAMAAFNPFAAATGLIASGAGQDRMERAILGAGAVTQPLLDVAGGRAISLQPTTRVVAALPNFAKLNFRYAGPGVADIPPGIYADSRGVYGFLPRPGSKYDKDLFDFTNTDFVARNRQIRVNYLNGSNEIEAAIASMKKSGASMEDIASRVVWQRNSQKLEARALMTPQEVEVLEAGNRRSFYKHPVGPTPQEMFDRYGDWDIVIQKSMTKDPEINILLGLPRGR